MHSSDEKVGVRQNAGPFQRVLFAFVGLLMGDGVLLLYLLLNAILVRAVLLRDHVGEPNRQLPIAWDIFTLYAFVSFIGWALAGLPIALLFPARLYSRLPWPLCLVIGAILGPLALLVIFIVIFGLQGRLTAFSLAHTEGLWPLSSLVSTISFVVYAALLRARAMRVKPAAGGGI